MWDSLLTSSVGATQAYQNPRSPPLFIFFSATAEVGNSIKYESITSLRYNDVLQNAILKPSVKYYFRLLGEQLKTRETGFTDAVRWYGRAEQVQYDGPGSYLET